MFRFNPGSFWVSTCTRKGKTYLGLIEQPELDMMKEGLAEAQYGFMTAGLIFLTLCG